MCIIFVQAIFQHHQAISYSLISYIHPNSAPRHKYATRFRKQVYCCHNNLICPKHSNYWVLAEAKQKYQLFNPPTS